MVKSTIYLDDIVCKGSKILYKFHANGPIKEVLKPDSSFEIDYYEDIETVPQSVLAIPFVVNVLPAVWLYDADLVVAEIDEDFYKGVDSIRSGYKGMYPEIEFGGAIVSRPVTNSLQKKGHIAEKTALLFSGGVDATSSLITLLSQEKRPRLITLWGSDVALEDSEGWSEKSQHTKLVADKFQLGFSLIKTGFRNFLNEGALNHKVAKGTDDRWWHGFQHGIGIIGHAAPLVYLYGIETVYIAASFTRGEKVTCASDPTIDEHVRVAGCSTVHEGYDYSRQDKIANIQSYIEKSDIDRLPIKVCWSSRGAQNCGRCEKCIRTACGFITEGGDIDLYGLEKFDSRFAKEYITKKYYFFHTRHWEGIQNRLQKKQRDFAGVSPRLDIEWILETDFSTINKKLSKKVRHYAEVVARRIVDQAPASQQELIKKTLRRVSGK